MAIEVIEPVIRSSTPPPESKVDSTKAIIETVSLQSLHNISKSSKVHRTPKSTKSGSKNPYAKSKNEEATLFRKQMHGYFKGLYSMIESDNTEGAYKALDEFTSNFKIGIQGEVVEFYRLVSFVKEQLRLESYSAHKDSILGIVKNLGDGFKAY
jgi:hypothetical protein